MKTRVYIVDGHALIRHGLNVLLGEETDMEVCGEAENGSTALGVIMKLAPDVVTVEICLQGNSGLELIKSIRAYDRTIGILVLSMYHEADYALRGLRAGARGFVSKQDNARKVVDAIRHIRNRQFYVSGDIQARMLSHLARGDTLESSPVESLSDRELEVGNLIGGGFGTKEIAARLHVSVKTVETHRSRIKEKLDLPNATRLQHFWVRWVDGFSRQSEPAHTSGYSSDRSHTSDIDRPLARPHPARDTAGTQWEDAGRQSLENALASPPSGGG
jgi:DNA-binding NarL/FixJ family response regulator